MSYFFNRIGVMLLVCLCVLLSQQSIAAQTPSTPQQSPPPLNEWGDNFDGDKVDETKWEPFTFEGGGGGKIEVKNGQLHMRGTGGSRAGVRSRQSFSGERFIVEATIAKVGVAMPRPGENSGLPGNAILTVLFDGSGRNRIEWLLTSDGIFEAWVMIDGRGERLDNHKLGTKTSNPTISVARKGDEYFFALNGQVGLQKTIKNLPRSFHVMLYGFGSSENNWDSVRVVTVK